MSTVIHYLAHPGMRASRTNAAMWQASSALSGITRVDLYQDYPRHQIDVLAEQKRLTDHDIVLFQFPIFWYSSPSLVKEWIDLTLTRGFAYGDGGDKLEGKAFQLAVTTGGQEAAYTSNGYQGASLRTFLSPFAQTAKLCGMRFLAPYVQYGALATDPDDHVNGFVSWLEALTGDRADLTSAAAADTLTHHDLPITKGQ